jgi:transglutaminase-like putative cysteine protease
METMNVGGMRAKRVNLDAAKTYHLPAWGETSDPKRIAILRKIALASGRDPRVATVAIGIFRDNHIKPRDYENQARVLLKFVQHRIYYANEPGERLQDPAYTLRVGYGDCDDMALLLAALCESVRLPWKFVISGRRDNRVVRWVEGDRYTPARWAHIYLAIGNKPFAPTRWLFAEPTLRTVDLGWDVVAASKGGTAPLPELSCTDALAGVGAVEKQPAAPAPPDDKEALTVRGVVSDVRKSLTPRRIVVGMLVGFITGILTRPLVNLVFRRRR